MTARRVLVLILVAAALPLFGGRGSVSLPLPDPPRTKVSRPATVEPTPPVLVSLRLESAERSATTATARLVVEVDSEETVRDLTLRLLLPEGVGTTDATSLPERPMDLSRGDHVGFVLPIHGPAGHDLPIRVEVDFHLASGVPVRVGQGVTLTGVEAPRGRSFLGAWEMPAVPLGEIRR